VVPRANPGRTTLDGYTSGFYDREQMDQAAISASAGSHVDAPDQGIAIVVLTHNRVELLRQCVENVLLRTSDATREIVIWDNASPDGTADYLRTLEDPRIRVVVSDTNLGQNAYARAFRLTTAPYFIELDDDVTDAPPLWDAVMLDAFRRLPKIGFLAADLEDDPNDEASRVRHHVRPHEYVLSEENGVRLLRGPAGGGCAMTSRELNQRVGGFRESKKDVFWLEDEAYIKDIQKLGFEPAVLADLRVHHTGGSYYTAISKEKARYWADYRKRRARRLVVKGVVFKVPFFRRLNARFGWFEPPESTARRRDSELRVQDDVEDAG
jgi:GT2 family glycosyltransferase